MNILKKYSDLIVFYILVFASTVTAFYYVYHQQNLLYGDALSRLNIARKLFDNLTPGMAQLGNVWLPLPQILMAPFVNSEFLWHSGIAGTIPSMLAFILGGFFIYKAIKLAIGSDYPAIFGTIIYAFNINLLYLQTTAMSEAIFVALLCAIIYFLLAWSVKRDIMSLIGLGFSVTLSTLTRYEGLAILASSILYVLVYSFIKSRSRAESNTIIFTTLACLGFGLWTVYLAAIFGDPLYWKNYYTAPQAIEADAVKRFAEGLTFVAAIGRYFTSLVWMNGLIPMVLSVVGAIILVVKSIKEKELVSAALFVPFSIFAFMVLTLMRNTPIEQPALTLQNILSATTSLQPEFNIRYGLILLPLVALLAAFVLIRKNLILNILVTVLFSLQIITYFYPKITLIYQLPINVSQNDIQGVPAAKQYMRWMKINYDGGLILTSALKHDPQMFQLGIDYKNFIHEGTGKYWKESVKNPAKYATWVVFYYDNPGDQVTKYLKDAKVLDNKYNLVYNQLGVRIYKIKDKSTLLQIPK